MKKILKSILCCIIIFSLVVMPVYATTIEVESYSTEKIKELTEKRMQEDVKNQNVINNTIQPMAAYTETPVAYEYVTNQKVNDCFEVGVVSFDTTGNPTNYELDAVFNTMKSVEWLFSGTVTGETEVKLFNLVKAKISASVTLARTSASSSTLGVSVKLTIPPNSIGEIPLYAHGYISQGRMKYSWYDGHTGQSGYRYENITARVPYAQYNNASIHVAPMRYTMWNGVPH